MQTEISKEFKEFLFESLRANNISPHLIPFLSKFKIFEFSYELQSGLIQNNLIVKLFNRAYLIRITNKIKCFEINIIKNHLNQSNSDIIYDQSNNDLNEFLLKYLKNTNQILDMFIPYIEKFKIFEYSNFTENSQKISIINFYNNSYIIFDDGLVYKCFKINIA